MRTLTTQETKALACGRAAVHTRVKIADAQGAFRDLTNLVGKDWVVEVEYDESIDQPVAQATVTIKRDSVQDSLAPLRTDTRPNLLLGSYAALVQPGAEFRIETATVPEGTTPVDHGPAPDASARLLWRLDESNGSDAAQDDLGAYPLTTVSGSPAAVSGVFGNARNFGGTSYVSGPSDAATVTKVKAGNFTIRFWIRVNSFGSVGSRHGVYMLAHSDGTSPVLSCDLTSSGFGTYIEVGFPGHTIQTSLTANVWHHVVWKCDNVGNASLVIDNSGSSNAVLPFPTATPASPTWFLGYGFDGSANTFADIRLDEYEFIDRLWAGSDITADYGAGSVSDWHEVFRGYIDEPDAASDPMTFVGRDLAGRLQDLFIESDRSYGNSGGTALETVIQSIIDDTYTPNVWAATHAYALRARARPTTRNGYWYRCTTAGTSGGSQPTWPTTIGGTVTDGSVVWTCIGRVPTLYAPVASTFLVTPYLQKPDTVLGAIRNLAQLIGWDLRYLWRSSTSQFELTLYGPDRSKSTADYTWDSDHYFEISTAKIGINDVRNKVAVTYSDPADLDVTGQPKRKVVTVEDTTSQDQYTGGLPRYMGVAEAATSQIDTAAEATALANAILADLKDPILDHTVETPYFWAGQLGDLYQFNANGSHYTAAQKLAVVSLRHRLSQQQARTTIQCRGKPAGAHSDWLRMEARPGLAPVTTFSGPDAPTSLSAKQVQGGVSLTFTPPVDNARWDSFELHVDTSSGFTISSSTQKATSTTNRFEVGDLIPGTAYYAKVVPRDAKGNRGTASSEVTIAAGYTLPGAIQPKGKWDRYPYNPHFEAWGLGSSFPPDCWTMLAGVWGTDFVQESGGSVVPSGTYAVKSPSASSASYPELLSQQFPVRANQRYELRYKWQTGVYSPTPSTRPAGSIVARWDTGATTTIDLGSSAGVFTEGGAIIQAPNNAIAVAIGVRRETSAGGGTYDLWFDNIEIREAGFWCEGPWEVGNTASAPFGATSFGTSWQAWGAAGVADPHFYKDAAGMVHMGGLAKNTNTANTLITTLPSGYRPAKKLTFPIPTSNGTVFVGLATVDVDGKVTMITTPELNGWHSLAAIHFRPSDAAMLL